MNRHIRIIHADGRPDTVTTEKDPELPLLQKLVGGYIELIPGFHRYRGRPVSFAYCNEDGRGMNLPINARASAAWRDCFPGEHIDLDRSTLRGDIVLIQSVLQPVQGASRTVSFPTCVNCGWSIAREEVIVPGRGFRHVGCKLADDPETDS